MLDGLKNNQAVVYGDGELLMMRLKGGEYEVNGKTIHLERGGMGNGSIVTFPRYAHIERVTREPDKIVSYVLSDGTEITKAEYDRQYQLAHQGSYDSLEAEIEAKKAWLPYQKAIEKFESSTVTRETVEYTVIGVMEDTGSKYITTPYLVGQTSWFGSPKNKMYRINVTAVTYDRWLELKEEYGKKATFTIAPNRKYLQFAKINGEFAFHGSWFKDNKFQYAMTLEEAREIVNHWRKKTTTAVFLIIRKAPLTAVEIGTVLKRLAVIQNAVMDIDSKVRTQRTQRIAIRKIKQMREWLEESLESDELSRRDA